MSRPVKIAQNVPSDFSSGVTGSICPGSPKVLLTVWLCLSIQHRWGQRSAVGESLKTVLTLDFIQSLYLKKWINKMCWKNCNETMVKIKFEIFQLWFKTLNLNFYLILMWGVLFLILEGGGGGGLLQQPACVNCYFLWDRVNNQCGFLDRCGSYEFSCFCLGLQSLYSKIGFKPFSFHMNRNLFQ